jgi:hypothetical protein
MISQLKTKQEFLLKMYDNTIELFRFLTLAIQISSKCGPTKD